MNSVKFFVSKDPISRFFLISKSRPIPIALLRHLVSPNQFHVNHNPTFQGFHSFITIARETWAIMCILTNLIIVIISWINHNQGLRLRNQNRTNFNFCFHWCDFFPLAFDFGARSVKFHKRYSNGSLITKS